MEHAPTLSVNVPLETEVIHRHGDLVTGTRYAKGQGIIIAMDVRKADWPALLDLPKKTKVCWSDVRTVDIQELSPLPWSIRYRVTLGDGWYKDASGAKKTFGVGAHLVGIDLDRGLTEVGLRAVVLLTVMGGLGVRTVAWFMGELFHVVLSKSAVERHVQECAGQLPDAAGMARALNADKPIIYMHMDEIFGVGQRPKPCTVVLRDQYGRIFAVKELLERTEESVAEFLREVKSWGITPQAVYMDGCVAYRNAVRTVFPGAAIQYDYFHVIQNIWKKLWKEVLERRRDLKKRALDSASKAYSGHLLALAHRLWEKRYLLFKRDENMSPEEREDLLDTMTSDTVVLTVRKFAEAVWHIFNMSKSADEAKLSLEALRARPEVKKDSVYDKVVTFLDDRFEDMTAYLRCPHMQRNSLAETGIRLLRRMEQGHDGFRSADGLDRHLRIYQAVRYLGWSVHRFHPGLGLVPKTLVEDAAPS